MNKETNKSPSKECKWSYSFYLFGILIIGLILLVIHHFLIPYLQELSKKTVKTVETTITREARFCKNIALPQINHLFINNKDKRNRKAFPRLYQNKKQSTLWLW